MILDDMFQPLSIIRQGYRSVLDPQAHVYDTWPKKFEEEFHRKVRTLAGNFQLFQLAPWTLTPQNRVLFQLVSHKVMRLVVPYLLVLLLISAVLCSSPVRLSMRHSPLFRFSAGRRYRRPALSDSRAASRRGSGQCAARAQRRRRRRPLQISVYARPTLEDMEFKSAGVNETTS